METFARFGDTINNAFFFIVDMIINLQRFFIGQAWHIGRVVLIIAILSAGFNYALTGTGLKENIIKILKATVFFLVIMFAYPSIIGYITSWTFSMAEGSVYGPVRSYFNEVVGTLEMEHNIVITESPGSDRYQTFTRTIFLGHIVRDKNNLLDGMSTSRIHPQL